MNTAIWPSVRFSGFAPACLGHAGLILFGIGCRKRAALTAFTALTGLSRRRSAFAVSALSSAGLVASTSAAFSSVICGLGVWHRKAFRRKRPRRLGDIRPPSRPRQCRALRHRAVGSIACQRSRSARACGRCRSWLYRPSVIRLGECGLASSVLASASSRELPPRRIRHAYSRAHVTLASAVRVWSRNVVASVVSRRQVAQFEVGCDTASASGAPLSAFAPSGSLVSGCSATGGCGTTFMVGSSACEKFRATIRRA